MAKDDLPYAWQKMRGSRVSTRYKNDDGSESTVESYEPYRINAKAKPSENESMGGPTGAFSDANRDLYTGLTSKSVWDGFFKHPSPPSLAPAAAPNAPAMAEHFTPGRGGFSFGAAASSSAPIAAAPPAAQQPFSFPTVLPTREYGSVIDSGVSRALNPQGFLTTTTQGVGGDFISPMSTAEMRQTELQYASRDSAGFPMPVTGRANYMQRLKRLGAK